MKNKRLLLTVATTLFAMGISAQDWKSYSYVEAQGGLQMTSDYAPAEKLITPTAALSFGHYFTPVVGTRLHINAWQSKCGFTDLDQYYKWKYVTPDLDLMFNLTNLFSKSNNHFLNVILLGGVGLNYAWDNDELASLNIPTQRIPLAWKDNHLSHNIRAGLRLETNQSKTLGLSLEVNANSLDDRFNSRANDVDDWMFTAMLGLNVRLGHKKAVAQYITRIDTVYDEVVVEEPEMVKVKEQRPIIKEEKKSINEAIIFFNIRESDSNEAIGTDEAIKKVAELMKTSDDAMFTVTGYADKGTGNATLNRMYSKNRAEDVTNKLIKEHGLDAKRIKMDYKGDTVQPFAENDKNRCVIITGEGTFKVTTYEEVEVEKQVMKKVKKIVPRAVEVQERVN